MGREQNANPFAAWKSADGVVPTKAYDRNGREIKPGDVVHLLNKADIMWRVKDVKPMMDPRMPPGTLELTLISAFVTGVGGGQPIIDVIKVRDVSEQPAVDAPQGEDSGEEKPSGIIV